MRGDRDWVDFWTLKSQLPSWSRYRAAKLYDPEIVEALANMPEPKDLAHPPLEGYDPVVARLDSLIDRVTQSMYLSGHQDPSKAPTMPRPVLPHEARRKEIRKRILRRLTANFD